MRPTLALAFVLGCVAPVDEGPCPPVRPHECRDYPHDVAAELELLPAEEHDAFLRCAQERYASTCPGRCGDVTVGCR